MKQIPQVDENLKLIRVAIAKLGIRPSARKIGTNPMAVKRFVDNSTLTSFAAFCQFASLAGYTVKLQPVQPQLPFKRKRGRPKLVTAEPPAHVYLDKQGTRAPWPKDTTPAGRPTKAQVKALLHAKRLDKPRR